MAQTGYTPILIYASSTGGVSPAAGNLTNSTLGSELAINITDGKLFYKDNANAVQVIGWKTTPTTAGGTGLTSYTAGDLLYFASGTTLSKLAIGASTTILTSSGTAPQWSSASGISVGTATNIAGGAAGSVPYQTGAGATSLLAIGSAYQALQVNAGGTAPSWQPSATSVMTAQGDLLYASAANTLARLAKNTTATRYLANTGTTNNPQWDQVNLTNGVTGTLPVGNGGTGTATAFTAGSVVFAGASGVYTQDNTNFFWDDTNNRLGIGINTPAQLLDVRSGSAATIRIGSLTHGGSGDEFGNIEFYWADPDAAEVKCKVYAKNVGNVGPGGGGAADLLFAARPAFGSLTEYLRVEAAAGVVRPGSDNTQNLGSASYRWATVYAGNGTINTSDRNEKTDVLEIDDAERRVAVRIKSLFRKFRMKDAVAIKGDGARIHFGVVAQDVMDAFQAEGLDASRYGLFCKDVWREYDGKPVPVNSNNEYIEQYYTVDGEKLDLKGNDPLPVNAVFVENVHPTQERIRYGVRYEELLAFVVAAM